MSTAWDATQQSGEFETSLTAARVGWKYEHGRFILWIGSPGTCVQVFRSDDLYQVSKLFRDLAERLDAEAMR